MTDISVVDRHPQQGSLAINLVSEASVADYLALMKPRVMSLVVFTALVGLVLAPVHVHPVIGFTALLCIAVGAGAAGALNMWFDADVDAVVQQIASTWGVRTRRGVQLAAPLAQLVRELVDVEPEAQRNALAALSDCLGS